MTVNFMEETILSSLQIVDMKVGPDDMTMELWRKSENLLDLRQITYLRFDKKNKMRFYVLDSKKIFFVSGGTFNFEFMRENQNQTKTVCQGIVPKEFQPVFVPEIENMIVKVTSCHAPAKIYIFDEICLSNYYESAGLLNLIDEKTEIDGVYLQKFEGQSSGPFEFELPIHRQKNGSIVRSTFTRINPGEICGFFGSDRTDQFTQLFFEKGKSVVVLFDNREHSSTFGKKIMLSVNGTKNPKVITIPSGVLYAYKNIGEYPNSMLTISSHEDRDELRIKYNSRRIGFDWHELKFKKWFV
mgnify:CR=1 FL=1